MLYEWLKDYQKTKQDIEYLEYQIDRNKRELGRWMSGDLSGMKLQRESLAANLEETIAGIEFELAHKMNDLYDAKKLISRFKGLENQILYQKYVLGKEFSEIANELGYTTGHIYNKHAQIMKTIDFAFHINLT